MNKSIKVSAYNIYFAENEKFYVYNTLTTSVIAIPHELQEAMKLNSINNLTPDVFSVLQQNGFVVDANFDEERAYEHFYNDIQYSKTTEELRLVLLPTYSCNLKCRYCFEECTIKQNLSKEDINSILHFVESEIKSNSKYKTVNFYLFGGEPLVSKEICINIADRIRCFCNSQQLNYKSHIITNATLIDQDVIDRLIKPNAMRIQITLDGDKNTHDERRIYRNGKGTYDEICKAIDLLNDNGLKHLIELRINIDKENICCLEAIFDKFHDKVDYIYVALLRAVGNYSCHGDICFDENDYLLYMRPSLISMYKKYRIVMPNGLIGKKQPCAMNRPNSFIIDPQLDVYKCDNLVGQTQYAVGKIEKGIFYKNCNYTKQLTWSPFRSSECVKCKLLPACASNCGYLCLIKNGSFDKPACEFSEEQLIERVKQYIKELS